MATYPTANSRYIPDQSIEAEGVFIDGELVFLPTDNPAWRAFLTELADQQRETRRKASEGI